MSGVPANKFGTWPHHRRVVCIFCTACKEFEEAAKQSTNVKAGDNQRLCICGHKEIVHPRDQIDNKVQHNHFTKKLEVKGKCLVCDVMRGQGVKEGDKI